MGVGLKGIALGVGYVGLICVVLGGSISAFSRTVVVGMSKTAIFRCIGTFVVELGFAQLSRNLA